ncbi:MAG: MotA/TolQ/ExbB proton channel family protein [candidate division Zixibacteria bacterium]|nr:MotA/TolQ/ExbB proton channel family protein [Candidatus Tariuqbacter arcticus]
MNITTVFGILLSFTLLIGAIIIGAGTTDIFINPYGAMIVLGGIFGATLISYPLKDVVRVFWVFFVVFRREEPRLDRYIRLIVNFSTRARSGMLNLEAELPRIKNLFLRDGIQMLVDGYSSEEIKEMLESRIHYREVRELSEAQIFRTMAAFAPAFGMVGTLIGLIAMLLNMSPENLSMLGPNMALALVTTFYGLILANLVFKPIALKLERKTEEAVLLMNMITDSVIMIQKEWHPQKVEDYLNAYVPPHTRTAMVHRAGD